MLKVKMWMFNSFCRVIKSKIHLLSYDTTLTVKFFYGHNQSEAGISSIDQSEACSCKYPLRDHKAPLQDEDFSHLDIKSPLASVPRSATNHHKGRVGAPYCLVTRDDSHKISNYHPSPTNPWQSSVSLTPHKTRQ